MKCFLSVMLSWLIGHEKADDVFQNGGRIKQADISIPISSKFGNSQINLSLLEPYLQRSALKCVQKQIELTRKNNYEWQCHICEVDLSECESVGCDVCLHWFHLRCLKRTRTPCSNFFFCKSCLNEANAISSKQKNTIFSD